MAKENVSRVGTNASHFVGTKDRVSRTRRRQGGREARQKANTWNGVRTCFAIVGLFSNDFYSHISGGSSIPGEVIRLIGIITGGQFHGKPKVKNLVKKKTTNVQ